MNLFTRNLFSGTVYPGKAAVMPGEADFFAGRGPVSSAEERRKEARAKNISGTKKIIPAASAARMIWWGMVDLPHSGHKLRLHRSTQ